MSFSVIIPSRNEQNALGCLQAVRKHEPLVSIHIIWDEWNGGKLPSSLADEHFCLVTYPFVFSKNVNYGIMLAKGDGVILLNDDALLQTPGGFTAMAAVAHDHPEYGIIAATTNVVGNLNQLPKGIGLREEPRQVCFICVYIPRATIEKVGLLDERFVDYGCEDDDYCLRIRKAGLKLGIFDGCFVDHGSLTSSFRGGPRAGGDYMPNMKRFIAKWGHDNFGRSCRA